MTWALRRLVKTLLVGTYLLIGVCFVLTAFGIMEPWGAWSEAKDLLWSRIENPWHALGAVMWLGIGVLFFMRD